MPQVPDYPADTPVSGDKFIFNKVSNNTTKTVTLANLATAIRTLIASFFTSSTVVPSTAPSSGQVLIGNAGGTAYVKQTISGDLGVTNSGVATIPANTVTYAKMQNISAASRLLGRGSASGAGDPEELTVGSGLQIVGTEISATGVSATSVTASSNFGTDNVLLRSDGTVRGAQATGITVDDSDNISGIDSIETDEVNADSINLVGGNIAISKTLTTDDTCSGITLSGINGGETIAQWEVVYYSGADLEWMKADADAAGKFPAAGLAKAATTNGASASVLTQGFARNDAWTWTPGAVLYLSDTPGAMTETPPATTGDCVQPVGFAVTADIVYVNFTPAFTLVP